MFAFFQTLFPKKCPCCGQILPSNGPLVCSHCSLYLTPSLRYSCAVCSRDLAACPLCQNGLFCEAILATFESSCFAKRFLKKAETLAGWSLHQAIASAMWMKLITRGEPLFQKILPLPESFWGSWRRSQSNSSHLNKELAALVSKKVGLKKERWMPSLSSKTGPSGQKILLLAAFLSEKELLHAIKQLRKKRPQSRFTFLIGCWRS